MADQTHDRVVIRPRERPLSDDLDRDSSQLDRTVRDLVRAIMSVPGAGVLSGFFADSFLVGPHVAPNMSVIVSPGLGYIDAPGDVPSAIGGVLGLDDLSPYKPLVIIGAQTIAVDASPVAGQNRIDVLEVKVDRRLENPSSRDVLDNNPLSPTYLQFVPGLINKTLSFVLDGRSARVVTPAASTTGIGYKVGAAAPAGTEVAPATTAGYVKIAEIHVVGGVTTILAGAITDTRLLLPTGASLAAAFVAQVHTWLATQTFVAQIVAQAGMNANLQRIVNVLDPVAPQDAATRAWALTKGNSPPVGQQLSASSGFFTTASPTPVDVTNLSVTITTTGRPVLALLVPDGAGLANLSTVANNLFDVYILRGATVVGIATLSATSSFIRVPASLVVFDAPAAGTYTYKVQVNSQSSGNVSVENAKLLVFEL